VPARASGAQPRGPFAGPGTKLALIARGQDGLDGCEADVRALGAEALVLSCDVADAEAVEHSAQRIEQELGPIDVWVNNAMVSVFAPVIEITADEYRRVTEVTYLGVVYGTLSALRRMRPRDRGMIVQVGLALDVVRSRLPRHPQPVPPIYQPELAATAIVAAAKHPGRREWWVGAPTAVTPLGNAIAPGLGDRYLAHSGYGSQQTSTAVPPGGRANNLFEPLPGDRGAHGDFDDRAHARSLQWLATRHRRALAGAGAVLAGGALAIAATRHARV
jgi:NAD(P)-dependent dehydrogenase (short-subunit alcohol dehydrogenase family)